ncbi:MAG: helical backbone metal receptor [bacterium]|nr:helical backbone metal receptor [bacterium]
MPTDRIVTDSLGRCVAIPSSPQRLVSLVPSITEVLFNFGWGREVVGITDYCTEPADQVVHKNKLGGTKNPNLQAILQLRPQLVFAVEEENRRQDIERLDAQGVPVYVFEPRTVRDGIDLLWRIAELLDCKADVEIKLHEIEAAYQGAITVTAEKDRVRVFCPIWKDPYITINRATYVHDMLRVCGGDNIFAQRQRRFPLAADLRQEAPTSTNRTVERDRRYPRVSLDEMASRRPDIILLPDEPYIFTESDRDDFLSFNDVPAVQQQRIYLIDGKIISWYGTRIGESLRTLQKYLLY